MTFVPDYCFGSVADPGFFRGEGANPKGGRGAPTYYLANFSQKLHENEEILGRGGGRRVPRAPLRSATADNRIISTVYLPLTQILVSPWQQHQLIRSESRGARTVSVYTG